MSSKHSTVLVDGSTYHFAPSGGAFVYLNELLKRFPQNQNIQLDLVLPRDASRPAAAATAHVVQSPVPTLKWFPNGKLKELLRPLKDQIQKKLWERKTTGKTLYHAVWYYPFPDPKVPTLMMVHDLIQEKFPQYYPPGASAELLKRKKDLVEHAKHFVAVSDRTKQDLIEVYGVEPARISVIYHGVDHSTFFPMPKVSTERPYFLYVGGRLNHKNFQRLLNAFSQSSVRKDYTLLVAGFEKTAEEGEAVKRLGVESQVEFVPNPKTEKLAQLYRGATAFVLPSLYEGFGIPLVEAMACGTPVIASSTGPLKEIAQEGALYFDPFDESDIQKALEEVSSPANQKALRSNGIIRAQSFTWERATLETLGLYQKLLDDC